MVTEVKFVKDDVAIGSLLLDDIEPISGISFATLACDAP
jgi:hypothetical protein